MEVTGKRRAPHSLPCSEGEGRGTPVTGQAGRPEHGFPRPGLIQGPAQPPLRQIWGESKALLLHKVGKGSRFHGASEEEGGRGTCSQTVGSPQNKLAFHLGAQQAW